ncbi:MAG TPA: cytochrome P450 [Jatrophihabitans sp.]|jgi:cytochrome P450|nr:cytochrome P450 [Jatrophihabitans sp.]
MSVLAGTSRPVPKVPAPAVPKLLLHMMFDRTRAMVDMAQAYGDAVRLPLGRSQLHFFNHPSHAKHVLTENAGNYLKGIGQFHAKRALGDGLLTAEGETWRRQRQNLKPAFSAKRLPMQADVVTAATRRWIAELQSGGRTSLDLREQLTHLTLQIVGPALMGTDLAGFAGIGSAFEAVQDQAMLEMITFNRLPDWAPLPTRLRFRKAQAELDDVVTTLLGQPSIEAEPDSVLALLNDASAPADVRLRVRDELVTMLLAGHETTATLMTWAFVLLDRHPEAREAVRDEAVRVLSDGVPDADTVKHLPYTGAVLKETLRLYPPVWLLPRRAIADDVIDGHFVPAGGEVLLCPYTLHRHPAFWSDPEAFRPERFLGQSEPSDRYAYLPFGAGPRVCIGSALGTLEATLAVAMISRSLRLRVLTPSISAQAMMTLRVRHGLPVTVEPA